VEVTSGQYVVWLLLICLGPLCMAQEVTVRIVNVANGRPVSKQGVSVAFLYDNEYHKETPTKRSKGVDLVTDLNGEAHFDLPEPAPVHFSAVVHMDESRWHSGGILGATTDLVQKGVVVGAVTKTDSKKSAELFKAVPGEILFVARPLSFFERLFYPIMKE
jgi:hypothetical protein